jgi:perosamine synthetase
MQFKVGELGVGSLLGEEEIEVISKIIRDGQSLASHFVGPYRDTFEDDFSRYCGSKHAVAVTSATTALQLACQVLHLRKGDEVVATPQTFRASYIYLCDRGVQIRFADIDPATLNIDPAAIEERITPKTRAIYVMDYGGNPVDYDAVMDIAARHHLAVVEDAAHSPGAVYKGRKVGSIADITCFSFHSLKNMNTLGEGGMLTTNNDEFADAARQLRCMGIVGAKTARPDKRIGPYKGFDRPINDHSAESFSHDWARIDAWGNNLRMSEVQAAVGSVQLKKLDALNAARARVAARYSHGLSKIDGIRPVTVADNVLNAWHLYPCFLDSNTLKASHEAFIAFLTDKGIQIIQRFFPVHLSNYMRYLGHAFGECPKCEKVWFQEQINLPINPRMPIEDVDYVVDSIREAVLYFEKGENQR